LLITDDVETLKKMLDRRESLNPDTLDVENSDDVHVNLIELAVSLGKVHVLHHLK